ncbi:hypothetical protein JTB14_011714 [Gonioctena quinquepunctata]|nr:hypothetical protein JTB14_011714 [Gonioctena quinquepunctata]
MPQSGTQCPQFWKRTSLKNMRKRTLLREVSKVSTSTPSQTPKQKKTMSTGQTAPAKSLEDTSSQTLKEKLTLSTEQTDILAEKNYKML